MTAAEIKVSLTVDTSSYIEAAAKAAFDAGMLHAETLVERFNSGRLKSSSVSYELRGVVASQMPPELQAAWEHTCEAHRVWLAADSPEGGRDLPPDEDPLRHAETCRVLLDEALAELVAVVDAEPCRSRIPMLLADMQARGLVSPR